MTENLQAPTRVIFGPQPIAPEGMTRQQIRDASLKNVKARMDSTDRVPRLQNKVAVITGAGPILGIGVSLHTRALLPAMTRSYTRHLWLADGSR